MLSYIIALATLVTWVSGHGRVIDPPSRASMWRFGYHTAHNYDDHGLNCGGFGRQYAHNGGRCGICGDPWDAPEPRAHELGGMYGSGTIVAEYKSGQIFETTVEITVYHKGYWYFKICPDPKSNDQACFDQYLVQLEDGGTEYYPEGTEKYQLRYRLPEGLVCEHCVLQWRYVAGNNWGICSDGKGALGCGNQENFLACSDITIKPSGYWPIALPLPIEFDVDE